MDVSRCMVHKHQATLKLSVIGFTPSGMEEPSGSGDNEVVHRHLLSRNDCILRQDFVTSIFCLLGSCWMPFGFAISTGCTHWEITLGCSLEQWVITKLARAHQSLYLLEAQMAQPVVPTQKLLLCSSQVVIGRLGDTSVECLEVSSSRAWSGQGNLRYVGGIVGTLTWSSLKVNSYTRIANLSIL